MRKLITLSTNLNGKLSCQKFIHIDRAPQKPYTQKLLDETVVEIYTDDKSALPSQWKINRIQVVPLDALGTWVTWASHGMDMADFWNWARGQGYNGSTPLAIYYYEKHTATP
jgi:hypothetical protein